MALNIVALMGRLTHTPELQTTPSGISVTTFSIAADREYQKADEEKKADFIDCVAWRNTAEFITKYFSKGDMIALYGSIKTDTFTDKDGNKRKSVKVEVKNVSFCGSKASTGNNAESYTQPSDDFMDISSADDLPF